MSIARQTGAHRLLRTIRSPGISAPVSQRAVATAPTGAMGSPYESFASRRSTVHSTTGMVACTQPLAARAGTQVLAQGGNAADAAVAVAAALNVTEPCSTGIGGDCFCLFYSAGDRTVRALNGSGRAPAALSADQLRAELGAPADGHGADMPFRGAHSVTVPGAAAGWVDTLAKFGSGKVSLAQVLAPAIKLAEDGFPVSEICAHSWGASEALIREASPNFAEILKADPAAKDGCRAPRAGEIMRNPNLARTFRALAELGKAGFYEGRVAEELVAAVRARGGHLGLEDLREHAAAGSQEVEPLALTFAGQGVDVSGEGLGVTVWEHPPNGQGIVALMALGLLEELEKAGRIGRFARHNGAAHLHALVEALRIAFADGRWWVADPDKADVPSAGLLDRGYLAERSRLFDPARASAPLAHGSPAHARSDTVYFAVTDAAGNGASFINSNYAGFGTAIVPRGCGFSLQNRGANFSLLRGHPDEYAPRKRPYHTIIPALLTDPASHRLEAVFGVMGGFMQPQGHVQVLLNMLAFGMSPQQALDAPRVCIGAPGSEPGLDDERAVYAEEGIDPAVLDELRAMGHDVQVVKGAGRGIFGRGQIIRSREEDGRFVFSAGSDLRGDGAAFPA